MLLHEFSFYFPTVRPCIVKQIAGSVVVNTNVVTVTFAADDLGAAWDCKVNSARFKTCTLITLYIFIIISYLYVAMYVPNCMYAN